MWQLDYVPFNIYLDNKICYLNIAKPQAELTYLSAE